MADRKDDLAAFVTDAARTAGLEIPEEVRPQVIAHFAVLAGHAACVMALELDDEVEPAPVFRA